MRFFFYGTLVDAPLRRAVLGRAAAGCRIEPATLRGFEARLAAGRRYPLAVRRRGAVLHGVLATLPDRRAAARVMAYEGPQYKLARRLVRTASGGVRMAAIFVADGRARASRTPWDLELWRGQARRRGRVFARVRL